MKLTDTQLEKYLLKSFDQLDKTKETCKVTISQCIQLPNNNLGNNIIRSCLETMDTTDLCKFFIINRSPNIKSCINFTCKVLKTNMNECKKIGEDSSCKNMFEFCYKILSETYKTLKIIYDTI